MFVLERECECGIVGCIIFYLKVYLIFVFFVVLKELIGLKLVYNVFVFLCYII